MRKKSIQLLFCISLAVSLLVTGCGGSSIGSSSDYEYTESVSNDSVAGFSADSSINSSISYLDEDKGDYDAEFEESSEVDIEVDVEVDKSEQIDQETVDKEINLDEKLIYSCEISLETKDFVGTQEKLKNLIDEYGIIIESEYYGNDSYDWYIDDYTPSACQNARLNLRIPSVKYHEFIGRAGELGHIVSKESSVENLTSSYRDNEARLGTLRQKRERLESFLGQAATVSEVIELENSIEEVNYEIERLESTNMTIDLGVMYSYIMIRIDEVGEYTSIEPVTQTFGEELIDAFKDSWDDLISMIEGFILGLARLSISAILPMLIVIVIVVVILKAILNKDKKLKDKVNRPNINSIVNKNIDENTEE